MLAILAIGNTGVARQSGDKPLDSFVADMATRGMDEIHPLTAFREKHNPRLSKADLAKLLGISRSHVHRIETGKRDAGAELLSVIKEKCGISAREIRPDLVEKVEAAA